ncbi:DMT family transporter [Barnesiella viscericola]|uniref:DMT family transporter n=1 Tax=Barnesiella viscericola TaxID=397865 RepID=UPI00320B2567
MGFLTIALLMGMLVPIQTAANARMRTSIGPVWVVTLISFMVSSLLLAVISAIMGISLLPSAAQIANTPWWGRTGGIIALCTITITTCLFRALGQLQTTILPLLGQLLFSLIIDHFGLFGSMRIPISAMRMLTLLLLVAGVLSVVVIPNWGKGKTSHTASRHTQLWQLSAIITGGLMASIGAIYGRLGLCLGSAVQASTTSFFIATIVMVIAGVGRDKLGRMGMAFKKENPWWMWLGGVCGAIAVFGNAWLIPQIGAGAFFMALLLGQISLSLLMEKYGWLGSAQKQISYVQLIGVILMMAGVALIRI